jgi:putative ABC transport system substrate-binding protein
MPRTTLRPRPALAAFRQGLEHLGWTEGRNIRIDYRFAPAGPDQAQRGAKELVALRPDILVGNSTPATTALLRETRTVPIVFVGVSDPVGSGFVASIARPGGNTTGFTNFEPSLIGKWLELLKQIAPGIVRAGVIFNPKTAPGEGSFFMAPLEPIARALDVEPIAMRVSDPGEIENAVTAIGRAPGSSLIVMPDAFTTTSSADHPAGGAPRLAGDLSLSLRGCRWRLAVTVDLLRRAAPYVDRILKGKPTDLPV